ncbi:MAG TPA: hypothetical protein VFR16_07480, partial [Agromyces mariniharenae]|nr:hypothetical protein [Agromyces mariniharenae]
DSALVGVAAFALVGLLGLGGPWWFGGWDWDVDGWVGPFRWLGVLWVLLALAGVTALIVWLARHASPAPAVPSDGATTAPAAEAADTAAAGASAAGTTAATIPLPSAAPTTEPVPPPPPGTAHHGSDEYAAWRVQQDAWRVEHDAWRRSQDEANRAARAQLAAENRARALEFQAQAEEARRIRRLTRPRTSFAYVVATLGAALVAGAIASLVALGSADHAPQSVTIGLAVGTIVTALAMVLAGSLRRRSGFLAFVTVTLLLATFVTAVVPRDPRLVLGGVAESASTTSVVQPIGAVSLTVDEQVADEAAPVEWRLVQGVGSVSIDVRDGARIALAVECADCTVTHARFDADGDWSLVDEVDLGPGRSVGGWSDEIGPGLQAGEVDVEIHIQAIATAIHVTEFEPEGN